MSISELITKDVDYILISDKEKKARLENELSQSAQYCVEIVSVLLQINNFIFKNSLTLY